MSCRSYKKLSKLLLLDFSESDVTLNTTYLDRTDNRIKELDPTVDRKYQWVFVFQQAVDKLPDDVRNSVHTRIFLRWKPPGHRRLHAAEENCICNHAWQHSCVVELVLDTGHTLMLLSQFNVYKSINLYCDQTRDSGPAHLWFMRLVITWEEKGMITL